ncbi:malonic semialdehyde reductase RutE [Caloramator mitchellensis]|uniref:Malonic semialdehyde reductase RutE n=1 Tax=Caloramator mitchellensis TaxID=908809 RepID=A0A0R3JZ09_CALMK|nr:nitroreductase family protein [Caloramator mitchellensis]KRQ86388.1 malonic semialdehyde reductase RutE [Caloramator mitchellensis]
MRRFEFDIMPEIKERWSPRSFSNEKISLDDVKALIEAARYAPSCYNEQPWRFIVAYNYKELELVRSILVEQNRIWADNAPVLLVILSKKFFENGKENPWHMFDAGTAWGYLSLEAQRRGLITHAMGGFKRKEAMDRLNISDDYEIAVVVAIGKMGDKEKLPEELKKRENPGERKDVKDLIYNI